jgi:hypothetical protein
VERGWTDDDRVAVRDRLVRLAADLPGVTVEDGYGHTGFLLRGRRIAWLLVDHHGDGRLALTVKAPPGEQEGLVGTDPDRYFRPAYTGASGWVGVLVDPASRPDWDEVAGLLEQAWRMTAGKRAVSAFDAARGGTGTETSR